MKRAITTLIIGIYSIVGLNAQNNREELREQYRYDPDPYGWIDKETGWINAVESFYSYVRINGLQLYKTVSENEFYQIMGGVNDSISEWGYPMYFDRSVAQQSLELSPVGIKPAPKYDYFSYEYRTNRVTNVRGITITSFYLSTTNFIFNEKIRVGDHIDKLQELGGSTYIVAEYDSSWGYGGILWSPYAPFPSEYKHYGAEVPIFFFNHNGIIISILYYEHGA
jgi:hypothetical protein